MKCCSRSTLGVVVGILNVICYIAAIIVASVYLTKLDNVNGNNYNERHQIGQFKLILGILIVVCLVMLIITGLFIMGIIKRLHKLMLPWLILSAIGFVINCGRFIFGFFGAIFAGVNFANCLIILVVGIISIAISALILWPLFRLYSDIRQNNIQGRGRNLTGAEMAYKSPENY